MKEYYAKRPELYKNSGNLGVDGVDYIYLDQIDENHNGRLDPNERNKHYQSGKGVDVIIDGSTINYMPVSRINNNKQDVIGFGIDDYTILGQGQINPNNGHIHTDKQDFEQHGDDGWGGVRDKATEWYYNEYVKYGEPFDIRFDYGEGKNFYKKKSK